MEGTGIRRSGDDGHDTASAYASPSGKRSSALHSLTGPRVSQISNDVARARRIVSIAVASTRARMPARSSID